jgi:PAS domain S-box-containing protein
VSTVFEVNELPTSAIDASGQPVAQVDLATHRVIGISASAAAFLGSGPTDILGHLVDEFVAEEPTGAFPLLAAGRLDGFEARRVLRRVDGSTVKAYVWAHVLGLHRPARFGAVFLADESGGATASPAVVRTDTKVIGTVDAEWRIDRISAEVEAILGYDAARLAGQSLLAAIHPNDLTELLTGLAHAHSSRLNAVTRLRVRRADGSWLLCRVRIAPLADPPCFAFTLRPLAEDAPATRHRARDLELLLARIGHEVLSAGLTIPSPRFPTIADRPELAQLSSREWEVLLHLSEGARVPSIATELSLQPSTVRNHLSSIFTKLGVRSQAELLDLLRDESGNSSHAPQQKHRAPRNVPPFAR